MEASPPDALESSKGKQTMAMSRITNVGTLFGLVAGAAALFVAGEAQADAPSLVSGNGITVTAVRPVLSRTLEAAKRWKAHRPSVKPLREPVGLGE